MDKKKEEEDETTNDSDSVSGKKRARKSPFKS